MRNLFLLLFCCVCFFPVSARMQVNLYQAVDSAKMNAWVDSVFDSMTLEERIGQLFVLGVDVSTSQNNKIILKNYVENLKIGGILFTHGTARDQAELTNYGQSLAKVPLLITLDGEWGLSMRLRDTPRFPINMMLGAIDDDSLIYQYGKEVGRECRLMGIHVNFAPVMDVNSNPDNPVIGKRSFGEEVEQVTRKALLYAKGLESEGVMSVAKHFPGHGDTSDDSHKTMPVVAHDTARLKSCELYPFKRFIDEGFSGVMVGHLSVPALDNVTKRPASLSPLIIDSLLRRQMGFDGLVFTDALEMKGVADNEEMVVNAVLAGNDILLKPENPLSQVKLLINAVKLGIVPQRVIEGRCLRILRYKYCLGLNKLTPVTTRNLTSRLHTADTEYLNRRLNEGAVTLLENKGEILPLKQLAERKIAVLSIGENSETPFQKMVKQYAPVTCFLIDYKTTTAAKKQILSQLAGYNTVIVGVHSSHSRYATLIETLGKEKNVIFSFFTPPYHLLNVQKVKFSNAVIMAYENTDLAQEYAAQAIFGGIGFKGKLPVTLKGLYAFGAGLNTEATRLGYTVPEEVGMSSEKLKEIDKIVQEALQERAFPGCQVLIARKGKIVYNKSFGYFDYAGTKPVENSDVYDLASVTKATATLPAVMKMVDQGLIQVDTFLSTYIPQMKGTDKEKIKVADALFHESGMIPSLATYNVVIDTASYSGPLFRTKQDATYRLQADRQLFANKNIRMRKELISSEPKPGYPLTIAQNMYGVASLPDTLLKAILETKLGKPKKYVYSCLNFSLLKTAVQNVSHMPIDSLVEKYYFAPLGAQTTMYRPLRRIPATSIAPTEHDHFMRNQILIGYVHDEMSAFCGGVEGNAGLFSSANDLAKLLQLYLNEGSYGGEQYVSQKTAHRFVTQTSTVSRRGLGFDKPDKKNENKSPACPEASEKAYGHYGYTGTAFWVDPANETIYIFLCNRVYPNRWNNKLSSLDIRTRIHSAMYQAITQP